MPVAFLTGLHLGRQCGDGRLRRGGYGGYDAAADHPDAGPFVSAQDEEIVGVLGCMAERVKDDLITNHHVDLVVGPDAYLSLPDLIAAVEGGVSVMFNIHREFFNRKL